MSKNTKQANMPENSYEGFKIELNKDQFLKASKKFHKNITALNKDISEIKLSDIQEGLSKALGKRNWRELEENFNTDSSILKTINSDNSYQEEVSSNPFERNSFQNTLKQMNTSGISKILSFYKKDEIYGENVRILSVLIAEVMEQILSKEKYIDMSEIYEILDLQTLYKIYFATVNNKSSISIALTNKHMEDIIVDLTLTKKIRKISIDYISSLPFYYYVEDNLENLNPKDKVIFSIKIETFNYHEQLQNNIKKGLSILYELEEDFLLYNDKWRVKSSEDWIIQIFKIFQPLLLKENSHKKFYFSDLILLFSQEITINKQDELRNEIINIINNIETYKEKIKIIESLT